MPEVVLHFHTLAKGTECSRIEPDLTRTFELRLDLRDSLHGKETRLVNTGFYSVYLNTDHLKTQNIWTPNFLMFGFQKVQYSNGQSMGYVLCTRPTNQIPEQYIRTQDGIHLSCIQIVGLSSIQMALKTRLYGIQPLFEHSNTRLVWYSDPHCKQFNLNTERPKSRIVNVRKPDMSAFQMVRCQMV